MRLLLRRTLVRSDNNQQFKPQRRKGAEKTQ